MTRKVTKGKFVRLMASVAVAIATPAVAAAQDAPKQSFNIPAQDLGKALTDLARQSNREIYFPSDLTRGKRAPALNGEMTADQALARLLAGSGLSYRINSSGAITVMAAPRGNVGTAVAGIDGGQAAVATGTVVDARTGANLKGALVELEETGQTTSTDDLGTFRFPGLRPGTYTVRISYLGYRDIVTTINVGERAATQQFAMIGGSAEDEIIVYGQRSARAQALNQERTADNVRTVISSDLLGNFTDTTISEALRRAPGVAFQRDARTGEGTNIIVRGLEPGFNTIQLNGLNLPVNSGVDRSPDLSNVLADSVERITISKSLLPSQESSGTGGLVEIETKSPLDRPRRFASFLIEGGAQARGFGDDFAASGTISGRFGGNENIGLSASVQYREANVHKIGYSTNLSFGEYLPLERDGTTSITNITLIDPRTSFPFVPGASRAFPNSVSTNFVDSKISDLGLTLTGELQLGDHTNLTLTAQRFEGQDQTIVRNVNASFPLRYHPAPIAQLNGEIRQALEWTGLAAAAHTYQTEHRENTTYNISFRGKSQINRWDINYTLGFGHGTLNRPGASTITLSQSLFALDPNLLRPEATDPAAGRVVSPLGARSGSSIPSPLILTAGFDRFNNATSYSKSASFNDSEAENVRYTADLGLKYSFASPLVRYLEAGIQYERAIFDSFGVTKFLSTPLTVPELGLEFSNVSLSPIGIPGPWFNLVSADDIRRFVNLVPALVADGRAVLVPGFGNPLQEDARTKEESLAAFVQTRVDLGKLEIIGGMRLDSVRLGARNLASFNIFREDFSRDIEAGARLTRVFEESATQTHILPRILMNYRYSDDLILRAGYFQTIARPQISQLSSTTSVSLLLPPRFGPEGNQPLLSARVGNPNLRAARTHNIDLSAEYYSSNIGVVKLGLFNKSISNLLEANDFAGLTDISAINLPNDPVFANLPDNLFVSVTTPVNNEETASIWGIEAAIERQFTFLPGFLSGFGFYGNYTFSDSSKVQTVNWTGSPVFDSDGNLIGRETIEVRFPSEPFSGQPRHSGTAAFTYNKYNLDLSLAYTYQGRRLISFGPNGLSRFFEPVSSLDFRGEYRFRFGSADARVYFEGEDLLKGTGSSNQNQSIGGVGSTPVFRTVGEYFGGRAFRIGAALTF